MTDQPPWHRLKNESSKAFQAFQTYVRMPTAERSIDRAYRSSNEQRSSAKSANGRWTAWSLQHRWVERANAYDDFMAAQSFLNDEAERAKNAADRERRRAALEQREWELAWRALDKLEEMLDWPVKRERVEQVAGSTVTIIEPFRWNAASLARLFEVASKTARLSLDMDTEKAKVAVEEITLEKLEAWLKRLEERLTPEEYARVLDALDPRGC
jgi:hypothetical protein